MKAKIKVCTAAKEFSEDQKKIIKRMASVLSEHDLSVVVITKVKKYKHFKLKAVSCSP
jgi:protease II